jgi:hypothetical protein
LAFVRERKPAVYRLPGSEREWLQQIEQSVGERKLPVRILSQSRRPSKPYEEFWGYIRSSFAALALRRITLKEAQQLQPRWMVSGIDLAIDGCEMQAMRQLDSLMPAGSVTKKTGCWISSAGCSTPIHWDAFGPHNLHVLLAGRKRVHLFAHAEAPRVYCYGGPRYVTRFAAAVDVARPDEGRFPEYARAEGLVAELGAGDVCHIPAYWWHHLQHLGPLNVSATRWFEEPAARHPREPSLPLRVHWNGLCLLLLEPLADLVLWLALWLRWLPILLAGHFLWPWTAKASRTQEL